MSKTAKVAPQFLCTAAVCTGSILCGVGLGFTSPALPDIEKNYPEFELNDDKKSMIAGIMSIGALVGCFIGGFINNTFGRKKSILFLSIPFAAGWAMIAASNGIALMYAGRFLTGAVIGGLCVCAPTYVGELSEAKYRGMLGSAFQLILTIGMLGVNILGIWCNFRILAIISCALCGLQFLVMFFVPESAVFLLSKGREEEAVRALHWLRGIDYDITEELEMHKKSIAEAQQANWEVSDLKQRVFIFPLILGVLLMFFQQMSGINAVVFFTEDIFIAAHSTLDPKAAACMVMGVQVAATAVCSLTVDKVGRKVLLLSSAFLMAICTGVLGVFYYIQEKDLETADTIGWLPVTSVCIFMAAFSIGYGPGPWIAMGELFSVKVKSFATSVCMFTNWSLAYVVGYFFISMQEGMHPYGAFWLFTSITAFGFIVVLIFLPETKGKSLAEITDGFRRK